MGDALVLAAAKCRPLLGANFAPAQPSHIARRLKIGADKIDYRRRRRADANKRA